MIARRQSPVASPVPRNHAGTGIDESLIQTLRQAERGIAPTLQHLAEQAGELARAGRDALASGSKELDAGVHRTSERTLDYIRHEPVKSVVMAAALGAAAVALLHLLRQPARS